MITIAAFFRSRIGMSVFSRLRHPELEIIVPLFSVKLRRYKGKCDQTQTYSIR